MIPWDDDIDVGMPRPDYVRFWRRRRGNCLLICLFRTGIRSRTAFVSFAKIRDGRSLFREEISSSLPIHHGVFIDVFSSGRRAGLLVPVKRTLRRMKVLKFGIINQKTEYFRRKSRAASWYLSLRGRLAGGDAAYEAVDRLAARYPYGQAPRIANWHGAWAEKEAVPAVIFGEGVRLPFDGMECPVPADYDGYLTCLYGDYRQLPPPEKRISHHGTAEIRLAPEDCAEKEKILDRKAG